MLPSAEGGWQVKPLLPAWFFIVNWIAFSSITILFNKYVMSTLEFHYPALLTCWHMLFSSIVTQILARTTTLLDARNKVKMTSRLYYRAILPIGVFYSASLVCSNQAYLYLSVAFIQMLKASAPAAVMVVSWLSKVASPRLRVFTNVMFIVFGVALASYGEVEFVWLGFLYQTAAILTEAIRLVMIQVLLSCDGQNMDPLVSLYYYAPVSAILNFLAAMATELSSFQMGDVWRVGIRTFFLNAAVAFLLNVASIFLIGRTSGLVMTLCGVLKNIVLVTLSVLLWGTIVTRPQLVGYIIALGGLVCYGVGYERLMGSYTRFQKSAFSTWELEHIKFTREWLFRAVISTVIMLAAGSAIVRIYWSDRFSAIISSESYVLG